MQPQHWGNVTTCHIGLHAKLFHEPSSHTWALKHYICLAVLMQVVLSGRLKFHTPLMCQYKQLLMSPFLSYKKSHGVWEQPTALGSMLRHFIWLLIRMILLYLRDHNLCTSGIITWNTICKETKPELTYTTKVISKCRKIAGIANRWCAVWDITFLIALSLRMWPETGKLQTSAPYMQKTPVWRSWWLLCNLITVF